MDDKEQVAIDELRAAGLEDEALAVEQLRGRHEETMDAYHAVQRESHDARQRAALERAGLRRLLQNCKIAMRASQERPGLRTDWAHMMGSIDEALRA